MSWKLFLYDWGGLNIALFQGHQHRHARHAETTGMVLWPRGKLLDSAADAVGSVVVVEIGYKPGAW
ncbi:hypothetical protein [Klebsiella pneumoniae]|uniref:hypothetical protein n=1 Tax=Klebsiella pneumoniae TaxID=573 RepID=UPI00222140CE|nr:hypothetical protein [Klebsiella pneumoniae]